MRERIDQVSSLGIHPGTVAAEDFAARANNGTEGSKLSSGGRPVINSPPSLGHGSRWVGHLESLRGPEVLAVIRGSIKLVLFLALACVIGVFISSVQVGGKSLSARASDLWSQPTVRKAVGEVSTRLKRGVESPAGRKERRAAWHPQPPRPFPTASQWRWSPFTRRCSGHGTDSPRPRRASAGGRLQARGARGRGPADRPEVPPPGQGSVSSW